MSSMSQPAPSGVNLDLVARVFTGDDRELNADTIRTFQVPMLAGALWGRLPVDHPLRAALRPMYLANAGRHMQTRHELRPLLAAWARHGIPFMLLKGFGLAEFEYNTPGERFYGDVDILIPGDVDTVQRAVQLAVAFGWHNDELHLHPQQWTHEVAHLNSAGRRVQLDLHRFPFRPTHSVERAERLTKGMWARAESIDWQGIPTLRPAPLDAIVLGLCLNRCWGGDRGQLKVTDYCDFERFAQRGKLTAEELSLHAERLGVRRTWEAFLTVCDPFRHEFTLDPEVTRAVLLPTARLDGAHRHGPLLLRRLQNLRTISPLLPGALYDLLSAWSALRAGGDPRAHLQGWPGGPERRLTPVELRDILRAIRLLTWLFYPRLSRRGACVPRAYASYHALRRRGHPVVFVSGVQRSAGQVRGHAWVEDNRGGIDAYGEPLNRLHFKVLFEYPVAPERHR